MTSISGPVQHALQARNDATRQKIDMALLRQTLDSQKQTGESINALLQQAAIIQSQISEGHLDIRV